MKLIFTRTDLHLVSFWKWAFWNSEIAYSEIKWYVDSVSLFRPKFDRSHEGHALGISGLAMKICTPKEACKI